MRLFYLLILFFPAFAYGASSASVTGCSTNGSGSYFDLGATGQFGSISACLSSITWPYGATFSGSSGGETGSATLTSSTGSTLNLTYIAFGLSCSGPQTLNSATASCACPVGQYFDGSACVSDPCAGQPPLLDIQVPYPGAYAYQTDCGPMVNSNPDAIYCDIAHTTCLITYVPPSDVEQYPPGGGSVGGIDVSNPYDPNAGVGGGGGTTPPPDPPPPDSGGGGTGGGGTGGGGTGGGGTGGGAAPPTTSNPPTDGSSFCASYPTDPLCTGSAGGVDCGIDPTNPACSSTADIETYCLEHPTNSACATLNTDVTAGTLREDTIDFATFQYDTFTFSGGAGCPAPKVASTSFGSITIFDWSVMCDFAIGVKAVFLALAFFIAAQIMVGQRAIGGSD